MIQKFLGRSICNIALVVLIGFPFFSQSQTATFNVTYNGFTAQAQTAFQFAADRWSEILVSNVPIKVNAHFTLLLPGMLGITFPNGRKNFSGAPLADTWYATSLANAIAGTELNPGQNDIDVYLNSNVNWYYDTSGTVPAGAYDLVTVAMHELGHGLGFVSLAKKEGAVGSIGLLQASDFAPLTTSFPWPDLDTLPSVFDRFLVRSSGQRLDTMPNPGTALGTALTSNDVYFNAPNAVAANNGERPRVYAPAAFELGSSISHFNESTFPTGNANEMMTPNGSTGNANHMPGPLALGALRDIGWNLNPALSVGESYRNKRMHLFPNPASNVISIAGVTLSQPSEVFIKDITGRIVLHQSDFESTDQLNIASLTPGFYFVFVDRGVSSFQASFVKQ